MNQNNKKIIIIISILIILQTIIFVIAGQKKSYLHMDEAYSYGLASYNKTEIQDNSDFYNTWHTKEYYQDYLAVNENEKDEFSQVYENQKNDSHPPFYYLLLRIAMGLNINQYSKWTGILLNIGIYILITIFMYLIISKLLKGKHRYKEKSAILAFISSIMLSSITNVIFIRMYALSTLTIVITTYLHLKLLEKENNMVLLGISISALIGSLTHYYYLFYLIALFTMFVIRYIKEKKYKLLRKYILAMIVAGAISLWIFPYSINHIFFGYRGQGVFNHLANMYQYLANIVIYVLITNVYVFNNTLWLLAIFAMAILVYQLVKHKRAEKTKNKYIQYIAVPTLFYFLIVSICSPFLELRYILPISHMIFILVIYGIYNKMSTILQEKTIHKIMMTIFIMMSIMIFLSNELIDLVIGKDLRNEEENLYSSKTELVEQLKQECNIPITIIPKIEGIPLDNILLFIKDFTIEPQVMYSNMADIVEEIKGNLKDVPALYLLDSHNNRFLDDILLFANIEESYIAKDMDCTEEKIAEIFKDKDLSNGILVFINDWQDNDKIVNIIKKSTNLYNVTYLKRLNMCDVFYIK